MRIGAREIGEGQPCFIVAEAGVNHNGDPALARQLVDLAVEAGADAVKFQAFTAQGLVTRAAPKAAYQIQNTGSDESQFEMLRRLELPRAAYPALIERCRQRGIVFLCTPFDEPSVDFLVGLGVIALKVPSGEITNLPFLAHAATTGLPLIVSTGMSHLGEVDAAVRAIREAGGRELALLHCVSNYPAEPAEANLRAIETLRAAFGVPVGYSDHTAGITVALAAVALGACVIEKHVTLDRVLPGPDHRASLEPDELRALVRGIRTVEQALGHGRKEPMASERHTARIARKSLVAARDIPAGTVLSRDLVAIKRPGTGLPPALLDHVVGRVACEDIPADCTLTLQMFR